MNQFINNITILGLWNLILIAFVLLLIHQGLGHLIAQVEKITNIPVQFYWYDAIIGLAFIVFYILSIYFYKET